MRNKNYHEKRAAHRLTVISPLLKPLKQRLIDVTSFRFLEIALFSIPSVHTNNFGSVFPSRLDRRNYETKFSTHVSFLSLHFPFDLSLSFFLDAQNLPFIRDFSHVIT